MKALRLTILFVFLSVFSFESFSQRYNAACDTLKILGIGNSFTEDGMEFLPELIESAGIKNVVLGRLHIGGCSLERHYDEYTTGKKNYRYDKSVDNKWVTTKGAKSFVEGVTDENWDIIVIQQVSGKSGIYETYQPYLNGLIKAIRFHSTNAGVKIAWQQTWAYATGSSHPDFVFYFKDRTFMHHAIVKAVKEMVVENPIDIVIPTGTTIQDLRATSICDSLELSRDRFHLSYSVGRYAAACTWFQSLVAPSFKTTIEGNKARLQGTKNEITDEQAEECQRASRKACADVFEIFENKR
jgi:hypothetical protein